MMSVLLNLERNILSFPPSNQSATRWHRFAVGNQQKAKVLLGWASGITSTIRQILSYIYISADPGWCKGERTREEEEQLQCQSLQRTTATTKNQQQPTASKQQPVACCQQMKHFSVGFHQPQPFLNFLIGTQPLLDFLRLTVTLQPWGVGWG